MPSIKPFEDNTLVQFLNKNKCLLLFFLLSITTNCTIEKRLYNKGYHIEQKRLFNARTLNSEEKTIHLTENDSEDIQEEYVVSSELTKKISDDNFPLTVEQRDTVYIIDSTYGGWNSE